MAETDEIRPHAIMIPVPYQGHINPLVDLALNLASRGFTITFVNTEFVHSLLSKSHKNTGADDIHLFSEARKSGLDIRYTTFSDGYPLDFDRDVVEFWEHLLGDYVVHVDELMGNIVKSCDYRPFLITDTFSAWHAEIAKKYDLVNVSFWTQPALVFALDYHLDLLRKNGHFPLPKAFKGYLSLRIHYELSITGFSTSSATHSIIPTQEIGFFRLPKNGT